MEGWLAFCTGNERVLCSRNNDTWRLGRVMAPSANCLPTCGHCALPTHTPPSPRSPPPSIPPSSVSTVPGLPEPPPRLHRQRLQLGQLAQSAGAVPGLTDRPLLWAMTTRRPRCWSRNRLGLLLVDLTPSVFCYPVSLVFVRLAKCALPSGPSLGAKTLPGLGASVVRTPRRTLSERVYGWWASTKTSENAKGG